MVFRLVFLFFILFGLPNTSNSQQSLVLVSLKNPQKVKVLDLESHFIIKTNDSIYRQRILSFTDSSIFIPSYKELKDSVFTTYYFDSNAESDSTYKVFESIATKREFDSLEISYEEIHAIKKFIFKNRAWAEPFAWLAFGPVLGIGLLPVAAIDKGNEGIKEWFQFEMIMLGIVVPPLFIVSRKRKFDLEKNWAIKTQVVN